MTTSTSMRLILALTSAFAMAGHNSFVKAQLSVTPRYLRDAIEDDLQDDDDGGTWEESAIDLSMSINFLQETIAPVVKANAANSKSAKLAKALKAPFCETVQKSCNSGTRLGGRGDVGGKGNVLKGSEYMQPNTLDDCQDKSNGQPNDISVQKITVRSIEASSGKRPRLQEGLEAEIVVRVQARANDYGESRGFVYSATDAYDPKWKYVDEFRIKKSGERSRTVGYTIPSGTGEKGVQAVRVRFGFNIGKGRCGGGGDGNLYADVDDLAFAVQPPPTSTPSASPTSTPSSSPSSSPSFSPSGIPSSYTSPTMSGIRKLYDDLKEILFGK